MGSRFTLRRSVTAIALGAAAAASLVLAAPSAGAAEAQAKTMRLLDQCDQASWDVEFPGLCTTSAGSVTLTRFRADLAKGGNGNWWINNRNEKIDSGDSHAPVPFYVSSAGYGVLIAIVRSENEPSTVCSAVAPNLIHSSPKPLWIPAEIIASSVRPLVS